MGEQNVLNKTLLNKYIYYKRVVKFIVIIIYERIHNVDFTLRDKTLLNIKNERGKNSYSVTPRKHIVSILDLISFKSQQNFLDIGCGKGYVCRIASEYPFNKIDGIEYSSRLFSIAIKNMKTLGIKNVNIYNVDAREFKMYDKYNVYYMFNPFSEDTFKVVINKIVNCIGDRKIILIYHNPVCSDVVDKTNKFRLVEVLNEEERMYTTNVYVNK